MNNRTYDILKWIAVYVLPALGTLYFALTSVWNLPYAEQVVGTIVAVDAFLGIFLGISSKRYEEKNQKQSYYVNGSKIR
ncbi:MAG: phage holin [Oscillospiraceae bacterium]|nr:phage holin [Oscillospiraceae bacterium]